MYRDRIGCEIARERGGRRTRLSEKLCRLFFFFLTGVRCKVFHQAGNYYTRGDGDFILSEKNGLIFIVFAVLLCRAVLSLSYIGVQTYRISKEENKYPIWGMYVRTCERA